MLKRRGLARQLMTSAARACGVLVAGGALAGHQNSSREHSDHALTLAVCGDAPYGTSPSDTAEFDATPAFIDWVNNDPKVELVLHVGDNLPGKQLCTQA